MRTLDREIERALEREYHDDHLSNEERAALVARYRQERPNEILPNDLTEAFMQIVY